MTTGKWRDVIRTAEKLTIWLVLGLLFYGSPALAQNYPTRPVRLVVGFSAGGATDTVARLLNRGMSEALGQPVVVDNKPGAGSTIAAELVARSPADGYTLLMGTVSLSISYTVYRNLKYDALKDFAPVTQVTSTPFMLAVNPSSPATNVKEFIALVKSKPGQMNYASSGYGSGAHLFIEMLRSIAEIKMVHVPYKSAGESLAAVIRSDVSLACEPTLLALPLVRAGKLRALGVTTLARSSVAPEIPTIAESGVPGYNADAWFSIFAPAGTPPAVINRLQSVIAANLEVPEVRQRIVALGGEPVGSTPDQFAAFFKGEVTKWEKVARESGIEMN